MKPLPARRGGLCLPTLPTPHAEHPESGKASHLIFLIALWGSACGVQSPPHPPRIEQPERVTDLAVVQVGRSVRLSFTLPRNATDGERLTKPQELEVLREAFPTGVPGPSSDQELRSWRTLTSEEVEKLKRGDSVVWILPLAQSERPPAQLRFAVRTVTRGFRNRPLRGEISPTASLILLDVPEAIQGLQAVTTEESIKLSWQAPSQTVTAYRVFRSLTGEPDSFKLIAETSAPACDDPDFVFGRSYFYRINAIVKASGSTATSDDSQTVEIVARDTFPPQAPRGLTALYTTDAVELIWNASSEADLRGYFVYRREGQLGEARLTSEPLSTPIFRDADVSAGKHYTYRVTAVDSVGNESVFSEEAAAEVP